MKVCKHCGEYLILTVNHRINGSGAMYYDLNAEDINSSQLHDSLSYQSNKYARCNNCNKAVMSEEDLYILTEDW